MTEDDTRSGPLLQLEGPPECSASRIGERIAQVGMAVGGKKRLAEMAHISESHLYRYIAGQSEPTASRLVALARAGNVPVNWLATGESTEQATGSAASLPDLDTLESIIAHLRRTLSDQEIQLDPEVEARLVRLLIEICGKSSQPLDKPLLDNVIELATLQKQAR